MAGGPHINEYVLASGREAVLAQTALVDIAGPKRAIAEHAGDGHRPTERPKGRATVQKRPPDPYSIAPTSSRPGGRAARSMARTTAPSP